jgi:hypothetical protein
MQDTRSEKRALQYRPSGKRDLGGPKIDGETQYEDGTGKMPNPWSEEEERKEFNNCFHRNQFYSLYS